MTTDNLWELAAEPGALSAAGRAWRSLAAGAGVARDLVDAQAGPLRGDAWSGDTADAYHDHRAKLGRGVDDAMEAATEIATALDATARALSSAQHQLTDALARVSANVPTSAGDDQVRFTPRTAEELSAVSAAIAEARQIRADLDSDLVTYAARVDKSRPLLDGVAATWLQVADGRADGWTPPAEATGLGWIYDGNTDDGNTVVLNTGPGDDTVDIRVDPATGEQIVTVNGTTVNGTTVRFPAGQEITIRAGEGNDTVNVATGTRVNLTLLGGAGDDTLRGGDARDRILGLAGRDHVEAGGGADRVTAGDGRDYVDGGAGDDRLSGGLGDDTIYGLSGRDSVDGGAGHDYLEGGRGEDTLDGGGGNDAISGGRDDDTVRGGGGDDRIYTGLGRDAVVAGAGGGGGAGPGPTPCTGSRRMPSGARRTWSTSRSPTWARTSESRARPSSSNGSRPTWTCCARRRPASRCWATSSEHTRTASTGSTAVTG